MRQGWRGGPGAQGGRPAQAGAAPGPKGLGKQARALSPDLTAARMHRTRRPREPVRQSLGHVFWRRRSSGARTWRQSGIRGLPGRGPGDRGPDRARALEPTQRERVRARPVCQAATAAQPRSLQTPSALTRQSYCPASPAQALAAEQHSERRLVLRMRDARRRFSLIGQDGSACRE